MRCYKFFLLPFVMFTLAQTPYVKSFYPPLTINWEAGDPFDRGPWRISIPNEVGPRLTVVSHHYLDTTDLSLSYWAYISDTTGYPHTIGFRNVCISGRKTPPPPYADTTIVYTTLEIIPLDDTTYTLYIPSFDSTLFEEVGWFQCDDTTYYNAYHMESGIWYIGLWRFFCEVDNLYDTLGNTFMCADPLMEEGLVSQDTTGAVGNRWSFWAPEFDNAGPIACCPLPDSGRTVVSSELHSISVEVADKVIAYHSPPDCVFFYYPWHYLVRGIPASHPWAIDSTSIIMSVEADTFYWGDPGLHFYPGGGHDPPWWCKIELNIEEAGLTFSPGDTVHVCLLDVTDSLHLVGPANHLGTDWHADYGPPIPYCWEFYISPTAVPEKETTPTNISLEVYPNPANQTVKIVYEIPVSGKGGSQNALYPVSISIHDILGKKVKVLFTGALSAGAHTFFWDGTDANGKGLPSGLYLISLKSESISLTNKAVFLK